MDSKVLVEVYRNNYIESAHKGWVSVSDQRGNLVAGTHNEFPEFFIRSSLKPVQALPFILSDGLKEFDFTTKELSIIMSSHSGEDSHLKLLKSIMNKTGLNENELKCGTHMPYGFEAFSKLLRENKQPSLLHCNCSGKHLGMLASCLLNNWSKHDYYEYNHPLQKEIRKHLSTILSIDADSLKWGIDGCGVPTYKMPLNKLAELYAKLSNFNHLQEVYKTNFALIMNAFMSYPKVIAGSDSVGKNRVDTEIMETSKMNYVSKIGGEAVLGLGVFGKNLGIAIKIEDGSNRPMIPVLIHALDLLKIPLSPKERKLKNTEIENNLKQIVGLVKPVFDFSNL